MIASLARLPDAVYRDANLLDGLSKAGQQEAEQRFSVKAAAAALEAGFQQNGAGQTKQRFF